MALPSADSDPVVAVRTLACLTRARLFVCSLKKVQNINKRYIKVAVQPDCSGDGGGGLELNERIKVDFSREDTGLANIHLALAVCP